MTTKIKLLTNVKSLNVWLDLKTNSELKPTVSPFGVYLLIVEIVMMLCLVLMLKTKSTYSYLSMIPITIELSTLKMVWNQNISLYILT
jgi:hypothetical protein